MKLTRLSFACFSLATFAACVEPINTATAADGGRGYRSASSRVRTVQPRPTVRVTAAPVRTAHAATPQRKPTASQPQTQNLQPATIVPTAGFQFRAGVRTRVRQRGGLSERDLQRTIALVDDAILRSKKRFLTVGVHTPWQIFHGTLALRDEFLVRVDNELVPAIDWMSSGIKHDALPLVEKTAFGGRMQAFTVPYAFEGHTNQFLAILSLSGLPRTHQFKTPSGQVVTMDDMVRGAQAELNGRGELTWTLWFLSHYVEPDAEWLNAQGEPWSMERLVRIESRKSVEDAPCGGTHRLFALALARNAYLAKHGQLRGTWIEADHRVRRYVQATKQMQNADGSLSEKWYKAGGLSRDLERRLKTSGHQLEWIMAAVPQPELSSHWIQSAVRAVATDVSRSATTSAECGALYHALDALVLYRTRMASRFPMNKPEPTEEPLRQAVADPSGKVAEAAPPATQKWTSAKPDEAASEPAPEAVAETEATLQSETTEPAIAEAAPTKTAMADDSPVTSPEAAVADTAPAPLQTKLPAGIDPEAAPTMTEEPKLIRTVSDPKPKNDDEATTEGSDEVESDLKSTEPPVLQIPAKPPEARKAEILEASFRFSNLDADGKFLLQ